MQAFDNIESHKKREMAALKTKRIFEAKISHSPESDFKRVVMKRNSRIKEMGGVSYTPVDHKNNFKDVYGSIKSGRIEAKFTSVGHAPVHTSIHSYEDEIFEVYKNPS